LYFRLNGISVVVPPLRERREEIRDLAVRFLDAIAEKERRRAPTLSDDGARLLEQYGWPGNVRELRNIMDRAFAFCRGRQVTAADLSTAAPELDGVRETIDAATPATTAVMRPVETTGVFTISESPPTLPRIVSAPLAVGTDLRSQRVSFERERILAALSNTAGNQKRAAELLGISRRTLVTKLEQYGIERPRKATR
jgi:DNA-binding NtrC family response regulator